MSTDHYGRSVMGRIASCETEEELRALAAMAARLGASNSTRTKWEKAAEKRLAFLKARLWTPDHRIVDASGKVVAL